MCDACRDLLNEALNLAVRSNQFEEQKRRRSALAASVDAEEWEQSGLFADYVDHHNINFPHARIAPTCLTMHLWVQDQYDKDLLDWQTRARAHLLSGCDAISQPEGG